MKNPIGRITLKRSIIVGIVFLFLSTACLPVLASEEKTDLINPTIESLDNYEEIITFISGSHTRFITNRWGIIRDVTIYSGMGGTGLDIKGWKRNPIKSFFYSTMHYINTSHFLGFSIPTGPPYGYVIGISFGNIEWR